MLKVVKIGGNIVDNPEKLERFLCDFARMEGDKILVHGGGKVATTVSKALGIETTMIAGRRVTDADTLRVVTMVYAGLINKTIVGKLMGYGLRAVGLSGADGGFITSRRRAAAPVDYGYVGDPVAVNCDLAAALMEKGYTLVAAPITYDGEGGMLNTNADTVASTLATALAGAGHRVELVYCFEKPGVLTDVNDDSTLIREITPASYRELKACGAVADGMLPKLDNAFRAIDCGVESVVICSAERIAVPGYGGTRLCRG